ncbi:DUF2752 domain-containing protein [Mesoterricola silvestris]|uniref:DUF2752 domain-containing protein n=1 Tax=Mesoterricola silvestris TaxID=2927979 RepID=A0AA48GKL5_9BACT|nr:DUF2752 domain-containing protein [Mesoterricola silvestris]BDU74786.1 hypothetical protein METEAL_39600 [Mesoterricola silvestris]
MSLPPTPRPDGAPRFPRASLWAAAAVLAWAALAGAEAYLERRWGVELGTCMFKRLTGQPCPTCGATRGALALFSGHPLRALLWNPLLVGGGAVAAALLALRAATGRAPQVSWTPNRKRAALGAALAAVLANWCYLIWRGV